MNSTVDKDAFAVAEYVAHYKSLDSASEHVSGLFEFESDARLGTKANMHDARVEMLEQFGSAAVSWTITQIERKARKRAEVDGQMELDFRGPAKKRRKRAREYW